MRVYPVLGYRGTLAGEDTRPKTIRSSQLINAVKRMNIQTTTQAETHSAPLKTWTPADGVKVIPLALETRSHVNTSEAAAHLLRRPQTLRGWAMREDGPIRPIRVGVRLMWPVAAIRDVLGVA